MLLQVESVKLSSESATRAMEAELANAWREAATVAASHKNDLASWQVRYWHRGQKVRSMVGAERFYEPGLQGQLDYNKAEVGRLRREFERVEGERDRSREEAKK